MHRIVVLYFAGLVASASAIVVQDYTAAETAPSGLDWSHVYNYNGSSAVAVGGGWILTARHVADDNELGVLNIGGTIYNPLQVVYHTDGVDRADLALVRFDKALPGHYALYTGELITSPKLQVLIVGFGDTGAVASDYWTASGFGRGTKRWGSQEIDRTLIKIVDINGPYPGQDLTKSRGFEMDFDLGNTSHEAGVGVGDSGGGVFYNDGGVWKLAGINTSRSSEVEGQYTATFAAAMPWYNDWVMETIPEPETMGLMGISTIGLFLSRAKRRRKLAGGGLFPIRHEVCDTFRALEEREVRRRMLIGTGYLAGLKQVIKPRQLSAWSKVHVWYKRLDEIFWNHMVVAHERRMTKKNAIKFALKKKALNCFDAFLALVMK